MYLQGRSLISCRRLESDGDLRILLCWKSVLRSSEYYYRSSDLDISWDMGKAPEDPFGKQLVRSAQVG